MEVVSSLFTIKEMPTDGHAPVLFHCSDENKYYCKYRINVIADEINCLVFEVIANKLLNALDIPTPEIAYVLLEEGSLDRDIIKKNHRMKVGDVVFGSKEIQASSVLNEFETCRDKYDFNKILNPEDIVKIAIFDLWMNNADRGRPFGSGYNYNLLRTVENNKEKIIAFDHAFVFGGPNEIGAFIAGGGVNKVNKLHLTPYYNSVIKYLSQDDFTNIIDNFVSLLYHDYSEIILPTVEKASTYWKLLPNIGERMCAFLQNKERIREIQSIIKSSKS